MKVPKVMISVAERQLMADADIILTKNRIIEKTVLLFSQLADEYRQLSVGHETSHPQLFTPHPKISKGEKQDGLPWVMLDYPRIFDKQSGQLAIRTFFWWGKFFSIQLQVSGIYLPGFLKHLGSWQQENTDWLFGLTDSPWDLQLPNAHWQPVNQPAIENGFTTLKLAKKIPIEQWELVAENMPVYFSQLISLITAGITHPNGEAIP